MFQKRVSFLLVLVGILLIVVACTPASSGAPIGSTQAADTPVAPVTGQSTATMQAGSGTGSDVCANVDTQQLVSTGETLYGQQCASCHGAQGEGTGNFPALANNQDVASGDVGALVQKYFSVEAHPKTISVNDLSALLSYVRGSFGNTGTAVCADLLQPLVPTTP